MPPWEWHDQAVPCSFCGGSLCPHRPPVKIGGAGSPPRTRSTPRRQPEAHAVAAV